MKIWLDDERKPTEKGWRWVKTASEAIRLIDSCNVTEISLDHDLGPEEAGTGYDVVKYLEEQLAIGKRQTIPLLEIHSANPVGRKNMQDCIDSMYRIRARLVKEAFTKPRPKTAEFPVSAPALLSALKEPIQLELPLKARIAPIAGPLERPIHDVLDIMPPGTKF